MELHPHPTTDPHGLRISAIIEREETKITAEFLVEGNLAAMVIPPPLPPARRDGLWRHSCFEIFVQRDGDGPSYRELNLSPSGEWAAYRLREYRAGMYDWLKSRGTTRIEVRHEAAVLWLLATIRLVDTSPWQVGLSAVTEFSDGTFGYWELAHPPDEPDFHHADCFTLMLPPRTRA